MEKEEMKATCEYCSRELCCSKPLINICDLCFETEFKEIGESD